MNAVISDQTLQNTHGSDIGSELPDQSVQLSVPMGMDIQTKDGYQDQVQDQVKVSLFDHMLTAHDYDPVHQSDSVNTSDNKQSGTLRIALVTETWPPEINGVAHSVFQLAKGLQQNGHRLLLVRPAQSMHVDHSPAEAELLVRGFSIPRYPALQFGAPSYFSIKEELKRYQPDVVHIVTEGPLGVAALCAARSLKIPVSSGFHSPFHEFSTHFGLGLLLTPILTYLRIFHNRTDMTCVPSTKTLEQLKVVGIKDLAVVSRGVNIAQFNPGFRDLTLRQSWGVGEQTTVLMYVGRLSPEKNIDLVIAAYRELQAEQPLRAVQLVLVGDGPDRKRLEKLAPDIIFAGMQTGDDLSRHYASADVFLFASQVETFGNVVIEAMASGLPVLAFNDAAAGQYVEPSHSGWLSPLANEDAFKALAAQLPKQIQLQEMGERARDRVQSMSWQQAVGQLEDVFHTIMARAVAHAESQHTSNIITKTEEASS